MTLLIISVATVLIVSALCSLTEAAVYAVRMPFVRATAETGHTSGKLLAGFKDNMEQPISAILIVNTVANTAGAAIAGAQARYLFGEESLVWFSVAITVGVLFLSEIIPKIVGVAYSERIAPLAAMPLRGVILLLSPMIWFIQWFSRWLKPRGNVALAPEEEVEQFAMMSAEEGSILPIEAKLVGHALDLNEITARDIMTPRSVTFTLPADLTTHDVAAKVTGCPHSRIPVHASGDENTWVGIVLQREVLSSLAKDEFNRRLETLCQPIYFVADTTPGHVLLKSFIQRQTHLFGVLDGQNQIVGVVTLEDVIESLVGEEIVDETDIVVDMQELARRRGAARAVL